MTALQHPALPLWRWQCPKCSERGPAYYSTPERAIAIGVALHECEDA